MVWKAVGLLLHLQMRRLERELSLNGLLGLGTYRIVATAGENQGQAGRMTPSDSSIRTGRAR